MTALPCGQGRGPARAGSRIAILAFGTLLYPALAAADKLDATVANMRFAKPLDVALVTELARTHEALVTVEEGCLMGGAGSAVLEALSRGRASTMPVLQLGLPDEFIEHGDPAKLLALCGLDAAGIEQSILKRFGARPALVRSAAASNALTTDPAVRQRVAGNGAFNALPTCARDSLLSCLRLTSDPDDPMSNLKDALHIPDTQSARDERHLAIQRVGVRGRALSAAAAHRHGRSCRPSRSGTSTSRCRPSRRARTCRASWPGSTRSTRRSTPPRCAPHSAAMLEQLHADAGPHRGALSVLPAQARAGLGRREPARVPGPLDRRGERCRASPRSGPRSSCR